MNRPASVRGVLRRAVVFPAVLGFVLLALLVGQMRSLLAAFEWVQHTQIVIASAGAALRHYTDAAASFRAYQLSNRRYFLDSFAEEKEVARRELADLCVRVAGRRELRERCTWLEGRLARWQGVIDERLARRQSWDGEEASHFVRFLYSPVFNEIRRGFEEFIRAEVEVRNERMQVAQAYGRNTLAAAFVFFITLLVVSIWYSRRQLHQLADTYERLGRREADQVAALRVSETRFRQLADSMPQIVFIAGTDGRTEYFNRRWFEFTGMSPDASKITWEPYIHPDDLEALRTRWLFSLRTGTPYQFENRLADRTHGGYRWHLVRALPVRDERGAVARWYGTCTDIHDQKLARDELLRSNSELSRFAFVASHDLKEPLRVVSNYVQMLRMRYEDRIDPTADRYIRFTVEATQRMYHLIDDLLTYSQIGESQSRMVPVDCNLAVHDAIDNLSAGIQEQHARIHCEPLPEVLGDRRQIVQLFQNLVGNALKYRGARAPEVAIGVHRDGGHWVFTVRDNGIGVAPEYYEKIFELFQRLHGNREYAGTGIGLALCKKIVERHGGKIWIESRPGMGSTFFFTFPIVEEIPVTLPKSPRAPLPDPGVWPLGL